jgi:hypothetical protein
MKLVLYDVGTKFFYKFHELTQLTIVQWLRWLVSELFLRRTKFNSRPAHENIVMGTVVCFPPTTSPFPCQNPSTSVPFSYSSYNTARITRTSRLILWTLKNSSDFHILEDNGQKRIVAKFSWISLFRKALPYKYDSPNAPHIFILKCHIYGNEKRTNSVILKKWTSSRLPDNTGQRNTITLFQSEKR